MSQITIFPSNSRFQRLFKKTGRVVRVVDYTNDRSHVHVSYLGRKIAELHDKDDVVVFTEEITVKNFKDDELVSSTVTNNYEYVVSRKRLAALLKSLL